MLLVARTNVAISSYCWHLEIEKIDLNDGCTVLANDKFENIFLKPNALAIQRTTGPILDWFISDLAFHGEFKYDTENLNFENF